MAKQTDRWGKMPLTVASDPALPAAAKVVFAVLEMHHNEQTGQCNPSHQQLAEATGMNRGTVARSLRELRDRGYIQHDAKRGVRTKYKMMQNATFEMSQKASFEMMQNATLNDAKSNIKCCKKQHSYNVLKEKEKKTKRTPSGSNLADLHKKLRPVWAKITKAKYAGGELVKLVRQHSEDAVIDAVEQISHRPEPPRKLIPYLVTMLRDTPTPKAAPEPPADPEEYDHSYEVRFSTQMARRPGGIMAIPTWGEN